MFTHAIVRLPGEDFAQGITTSDLGAPDYALMLQQHQAYVAALRSLGLKVELLDPLPGHPDAYFVEDPAIVTPEAAVVTRPGALARRGEADAIAPVLANYRPVERIQAPGTLDGGDVLIVGKQLFVGLSERTNSDGAAQLGAILAKFGYRYTPVAVDAGLHLKSSVNAAGDNTLLLSAGFAGRAEFAGYDCLILDAADAYACNTLWINDALLMPAGFPSARRKLADLGLPVIELEVSEVRKMDGGLTCMSLRL